MTEPRWLIHGISGKILSTLLYAGNSVINVGKEFKNKQDRAEADGL